MAKVITADDDSGNTNLYAKIIKRHYPDIEVVAVPDGQSLVNKVMAEDFSLILTDFDMPGITGAEAVRMIRSAGKTTPAYLVSSIKLSPVESEFLKRRYGITGYVHKSNVYTELADIVKQHCTAEGRPL